MSNPLVEPTVTVATVATVAPLARIRVDWTRNTRARDQEAIAAYAASIQQIGIVNPVVVSPLVHDDFDYELVAGFHRLEAASVAGLVEVPIVQRDTATREEAHAVENIAKADMWPLEEALAIQAIRDKGYTPKGIADVLGKNAQWISVREPLLALSDELRSPWSAAAAGTVMKGHPSLKVARRLGELAAIAPWAAQRLVDLAMLPEPTDDWPAPQRPLLSLDGDGREAGQLIVHQPPKGRFAVIVSSGHRRLTVQDIRDGAKTKRARELADRLAAAEEVWRKNASAYDYFDGIRISEESIDTMRALGVLFALTTDDRSWFSAVCFEREPWLDAVEAAIAVVEDENASRKERRAKDAIGGKTDEQLTPKQKAQRALRALQRDMAGPESSARAANHELFAALYGGEAIVTADVPLAAAKLFVESWLGPRKLTFTDGRLTMVSNYGIDVDHARTLIARVKLAVPELSSVETPTTKSGKPGKAKVRHATDQETWSWILRYLDAAATSSELFDRAVKLLIIGQATIAHAAGRGRSSHPLAVRLASKEAQKALDSLAKGRPPRALASVKSTLTRAYKAAGYGLDSRI